MTKAELEKEISRMRLEKTYLELKKDTGRTNTGKNFAKKYAGEAANKILWNTGVDLVAQTAKSLGAKNINDLIDKMNKKIGDSNNYERVYANNKKKS